MDTHTVAIACRTPSRGPRLVWHPPSPLPDTSHYQLVLRDSKSIGANAFALPSGIIIATDDLIKLTNDAELTAVLAHEVSHVKFHHSLRHTLQSSATALLLAVWLGDLTSLSSLAAAIPALLVSAQYSQSFELEADRYALDYLAANGLSAESFASALNKLEQSHLDKHDTTGPAHTGFGIEFKTGFPLDTSGHGRSHQAHSPV